MIDGSINHNSKFPFELQSSCVIEKHHKKAADWYMYTIPVGNFLRITAKSATGWPSNIVPFLCDPTARTSSRPYKQNTAYLNDDSYMYKLLNKNYTSLFLSDNIIREILKWSHE